MAKERPTMTATYAVAENIVTYDYLKPLNSELQAYQRALTLRLQLEDQWPEGWVTYISHTVADGHLCPTATDASPVTYVQARRAFTLQGDIDAAFHTFAGKVQSQYNPQHAPSRPLKDHEKLCGYLWDLVADYKTHIPANRMSGYLMNNNWIERRHEKEPADRIVSLDDIASYVSIQADVKQYAHTHDVVADEILIIKPIIPGVPKGYEAARPLGEGEVAVSTDHFARVLAERPKGQKAMFSQSQLKSNLV